jgi:hypothetical protein
MHSSLTNIVSYFGERNIVFYSFILSIRYPYINAGIQSRCPAELI